MVLMRIRCCCSWDDFVVYVTVFKTFLFAGKENSFLSDSHLSTCEFVLYFVLLLSWSCLQGRQADFAAIFVQIHMYNIRDASKKYLPFVSQKQCLSAVINTRGEFNPELPISQQSPDLQVINCLCSSSKSCCEVCPCYHGKQEQYCSKNTLLGYICSLKTSQSPCHEFLGETWLSGHGQDGLMVGLMVSEVFSNLNSSMIRWFYTEHPQTPDNCPQAQAWPCHWHWWVKTCQSLLDPNHVEIQGDSATKLGWNPHSYRNTSVFL